MKKSNAISAAEPKVRCGMYTRKSTEEGLQQEFNSLDAQREAAEAYIASQKHLGWVGLPDRYDDGGFTGGNMDRPALRRLIADIEAGKVQCVVVYKVDRLSRSLLDFARMMEVFERHGVAFVSITQQINSATSMGRLMLNVLLSFAQFEREIISERTRDKIAAARRKGKWVGGMPLLGYDIDAGSKLKVNADEAVRVRAIFGLYLEHGSLLPVVRELARRGWLNKRWLTRNGTDRGGKPFTKTSLHKLLTNATYAGQVRYKGEVHRGEHAAIVDAGVWQRVQATLQRNGRSGGSEVRNRFGALLKGLIRCTPCACAMTPSHSTRGAKRFRYYVCTHAQKQGWDTCPSKSVPAGQIEQFVVERIQAIGRDPRLLEEVLAQARTLSGTRRIELAAELRGLRRDTERWEADVRTLLTQIEPGQESGPALTRLADLQERLRGAELRASELQVEQGALGDRTLDEEQVTRALADFEPIWTALTPREQTRVIHLLVERVDYDGGNGNVAITFHPTGLQSLTEALQEQSA